MTAQGRHLLCLTLLATSAWAEADDARWGVGGYAGAAIDRGGFVAGLTGRARLSPRAAVALSAEFAPFFDLLSGAIAPGVVNAYASFRWTWLSTATVGVQSVAHVGTSALLFEPVGARQGAIGVFLGLSLLGVAIKASPNWVIEVVPDVTLAIPSLTGVPFLYRQYRLVFALVRWM